jgi:hypothetical protein
LNAHWHAHGIGSVQWFRVFEWTSGSDGIGHTHLHVWLFAPFIERQDLGHWWAAALVHAGCPPESCVALVFDIRDVSAKDSFAQELVKYLTKDIDAAGKRIPAAAYAEVYKAIDGRRMTQASRGFMALAERHKNHCECGADLPKRVLVKPKGHAAEGETDP